MRRRALFWMSVGVLAGCVSRPRMPDLRQAVAPTGTLRAGVSAAPNVSLSFAARSPAGEFTGPPVDILRSFAQHLAVDLELNVKQGSGQLAEALSKGELDIAFLPPDAERRGIADSDPTSSSMKALTSPVATWDYAQCRTSTAPGCGLLASPTQ